MEVSAAIKGRRSVRSYKDLEVESVKIEKIRNCLWMAAWHKFDSPCCAIAYDP